MAKSYRHTPIYSDPHNSDKWYKTRSHRTMRAKIRNLMADFDDDVDFLPHENEVFNSYSSSKDSRVWHEPWYYLHRDKNFYCARPRYIMLYTPEYEALRRKEARNRFLKNMRK